MAFGLGAFLLVGTAHAQQLGGGGAPNISLVRVFLALLVCLIVAVLAVLLLRQKIKGGALPLFSKLGSTTPRIKLVETRRIAPQSDLCLVQCDREEYLLLIVPGGASVLNRTPVAAPSTGAQR